MSDKIDVTDRKLAQGRPMEYLEFLETELKLPRKTASSAPLVYDLFAGCGGMALGFEAAGFRTVGFEVLEDACNTYKTNLHGDCRHVILRPDADLGQTPDLIIGGPPCQPFSVIGNQNGHKDERNGFPAFLSAVKRYQPKVVVFENVRGMLYRNRHYFDQIKDQLRSIGYLVQWKLLDALDYGVPQHRERLIVVAHRGQWLFPEPLSRRYTAGEALGDTAFCIPEGSKFLTASMDEYVAKYEKASCCVRPRDLHLDQPSRTVTCRNLNGATGDMLRVRLHDGRRRRLVVREGARLQSFPDWFNFAGTEGSQFNQVGNAVPPLLAKAVAEQAMACFAGATLSHDEVRATASGEQLALDFQWRGASS